MTAESAVTKLSYLLGKVIFSKYFKHNYNNNYRILLKMK